MENEIEKARQMLVIDDLSTINHHYHRLFQFDPTEMYKALGERLNPYKRHNWILIEWLFPDLNNGLCGCGCGAKLSGRRKRWASEECSNFAFQVYSIVSGRSANIVYYVNQIYDYKCCVCSKTSNELGITDNGCSKIHLEHTLAVQHGGGGCWLSNFTFMCVDCHKIKSKAERSKII